MPVSVRTTRRLRKYSCSRPARIVINTVFAHNPAQSLRPQGFGCPVDSCRTPLRQNYSCGSHCGRRFGKAGIMPASLRYCQRVLCIDSRQNPPTPVGERSQLSGGDWLGSIALHWLCRACPGVGGAAPKNRAPAQKNTLLPFSPLPPLPGNSRRSLAYLAEHLLQRPHSA